MECDRGVWNRIHPSRRNLLCHNPLKKLDGTRKKYVPIFKKIFCTRHEYLGRLKKHALLFNNVR
jgi:hypothetical protein